MLDGQSMVHLYSVLWPMCLFVSVSVCSSVCLSVRQCVCLFISVSVCSSVCVPVVCVTVCYGEPGLLDGEQGEEDKAS